MLNWLRRVAGCAALAILLSITGARAGDPVAGMALFNNVPESVISCSNASCHGPNPNDNVNGLQRGANNPGVIQTAIKMGVTQMMFLNGLLNPFQLDDLSAYLAPQPDLSADALDFVGQPAGTTSAPQTVTLRSKGGVNLQVTAITLSGPGAANFAVEGSCRAGLQLLSATIAQAGGSCEVSITYHPVALGSGAASVKFFYAGVSTFPATQTIALTGAASAALPAIAIDPTFIDFGEVVRGTSSPARTVVIANPGTVPLQLNALSMIGPEAGEFSIGGTCGSGAAPLQLAANASCTIAIRLTPQGLNARSAQLNVQHNAPGSPSTILLSGIGVVATCAPPAPPTEFQTLACPAGLSGTITQSRDSVCAGTTWMPGPWGTVADNCVPTLPATTRRLAEFFNTGLNHYFITADAAESRDVETGGAGPGWSAAAAIGRVWDLAPGASLTPVCRFYGNPALGLDGLRIGPNSHFYTADADECAAVKEDPGWIFEGIVFQAVPSTQGACPQPLLPLLRSYNGRFREKDSNHRYSTSPAIVAQMSAQGWISEGVVFCVAAD